MNIGKKIIEVEDRIGDDLPGAVVGDIASAIDRVVGSVFFFQAPFIQKQMFGFAAFAQGVNMGMFAKYQVIGS
ncbi:hypothetical protein GALL_543550 [mine drainage metagenome]|uniref:Uncharacterized protein n=1 Tax=mine drainage metagenome TaxID=410659 RepID=A0A1J5PFR9_9ZZZZ